MALYLHERGLSGDTPRVAQLAHMLCHVVPDRTSRLIYHASCPQCEFVLKNRTNEIWHKLWDDTSAHTSVTHLYTDKNNEIDLDRIQKMQEQISPGEGSDATAAGGSPPAANDMDYEKLGTTSSGDTFSSQASKSGWVDLQPPARPSVVEGTGLSGLLNAEEPSSMAVWSAVAAAAAVGALAVGGSRWLARSRSSTAT